MQGEIFLAGGDTYAQLERCFGRIADNRFNELGDRIDAGPITDARGDVWWLADDHFHRVDSNGQSTRIARIPDPIGNTRVNAILRVGKRLFVGVDDAPLAILDLEQRTWSSIPHVSNVQRLRGVAANDNVLALGQARYYWVDPQTLEASELTIGPASNGSSPATHWRDLRDLEFDGDIIWALRDNRQRRAGKSRVGLYRVSRDGYQYYDSASGYHLGELATVVQDPSDPARLWLLQNSKNGLIDFDKDTNSSALIGANAGNRRQSEILATAMSDPRLKALTIPPHETLDPDAPDLIWGVRGNGVYVRRGTTVIHRWPASLPGGRIELVRDTATTVWIASSEGLIEFPIEESLDELQKTSSGQGQQRRPR